MNIIFDRIIPGYERYKLYIYNTDNYPVPNKYILYKDKPEYEGFREYDGYSYEEYLIDKLDYQNVSNKPLVYNIKYYHHIEPDGTYVYEREYYEDNFGITCSIQNTRYDYIKMDFTRSSNDKFWVSYRMYPIWGAYVSPFKGDNLAGSFKIESHEAFGPMTSAIDNRTEEPQILTINIYSPNREEEFKFKIIKYPKSMTLNLPIAGKDKSKMFVNFNKEAQHQRFTIGYYCTEDINDLIITNDTGFVSLVFYPITSGRTQGNNYYMSVYVTENDTGVTRVGSVFLTTPNGERSEEIQVTQLHYVPVYAYVDGISVTSNSTSSNRLTKIAWNQQTFTVQLQTNTTVTIRQTTQLAIYNWPEFIDESDYPIEVTGDGTKQNITFNVSSINNTGEDRQGHIEFAMYDPIGNKTYKFDKVIRQLAKEIEDDQNS